jgi:exodeoxyribonuclease VII small subunit
MPCFAVQCTIRKTLDSHVRGNDLAAFFTTSIASCHRLRYLPAMSTPPRTPADTADDSAPSDQMASFETSLNELEKLVTRMEGGELSLDESLKSFERGIALFRTCQGTLEQAELRVRKLLDPEAPDSAQPFEPER